MSRLCARARVSSCQGRGFGCDGHVVLLFFVQWSEAKALFVVTATKARRALDATAAVVVFPGSPMEVEKASAVKALEVRGCMGHEASLCEYAGVESWTRWSVTCDTATVEGRCHRGCACSRKGEQSA